MSQGKSSGSSGSTPIVSQAQKNYIGQSAGLGGQLQSQLGGLTNSAQDLYNSSSGGVNQAATNVAQTGNALSQNMGQGGASGYATGMGALANLTSPDYQNQQIQAALAPAQQQYAQNLAAQGASFGGSGQMGSARQALAGQQLAGLNQMQQQQATAGVLQNIAQQKLAAGQGLISGGVSGGQLGLQGAQAGLGASSANMDYLQKLAGVYGGVAGTQQANPNFSGTIGSSTQTGSSTSGVQL